MVTTTRLDTPTRWTAALDRAHAKGVKLFHDTATGAYSALSTDGRTLYSVSYYTCGCKAGQGADPVCLHRAAFRAHLLREDAIVEAAITPQSSDLLDVTAPDHCTDCLGGGWSRMYLSGHLNDYVENPCTCTAGQAIRAERQLVAA